MIAASVRDCHDVCWHPPAVPARLQTPPAVWSWYRSAAAGQAPCVRTRETTIADAHPATSRDPPRQEPAVLRFRLHRQKYRPRYRAQARDLDARKDRVDVLQRPAPCPAPARIAL